MHYHCGRICLGNRKINLSTVFAGQKVGIKQIANKVWLVSFMQYDLGFFDHETDRVISASERTSLDLMGRVGIEPTTKRLRVSPRGLSAPINA